MPGRLTVWRDFRDVAVSALLAVGAVVWLIVVPLLFFRGALQASGMGVADGDPAGATVNGMLANPRRDWAALAGSSPKSAAAARLHPDRVKSSGRLGWDGEPHAFNHFQQTALLCNESPSPRNFETVWQHRLDRMKRLPVAGGYGLYEQLCVGWPSAARPCALGPGTSPVQLVGHASEPVTPIGWAIAMRQRIGGILMTIEDDAHGSLSSLPCAEAAVTFFDTGRTTSASCAGEPIPAP